MEVFVRNLPAQTNEKSLRNHLRSAFASLSIQDVHCQKASGKTFASLTFLSIDDGRKFLARHGQIKAVGRQRHVFKQQPEILKLQGSAIQFELSNRKANTHLLFVPPSPPKSNPLLLTPIF